MPNETLDAIVFDNPGLFRRTFRRHPAGLAFFWFVGSLAATALIYMEVKPQYRGFSVLRVEPPSAALYGINTSSETFEMFLQTQVQLIKSPNVLTAAANDQKAASLKRVQAAGDVVQELKKVIEVKITPGTYLLEVSMTSPDSYECAVIVNAVVNSFLASNEEWADGMTRNRIKKLEDYLHELENKTDELERRWMEIAARRDDYVKPLKKPIEKDADKPEQITIEQFKRLDDELFGILLELVKTEAWLIATRGETKAAKSELEKIEQMIEQKIKADPEVKELAVQMQATQNRIDNLRRMTQKPEGAEIRLAEQEMNRLATKYNELCTTKSNAWRKEIEPTSALQPDSQEQVEAETRIGELKVREKALLALAERAKIVNQTQQTDAVQISLIRDERASIKEMQEAVKRRLEQLRYESRGETRVRAVSSAIASSKPIQDLRPLWFTIALLVMMLPTLFLFLIIEAIWPSRFQPSLTSIVPDLEF